MNHYSFLRSLLTVVPVLAVLSSGVLLSHLRGEDKHVSQSNYFLYVGAYGKGVNGYKFHADTGKLEPLGLVGEVTNPSFLATDPEQRFLYAVSELEGSTPGAVAAFSIDKKSGELKPLNHQSSHGVAPCHLAVDRTGKMVIVANYVTGGVSSFPIQADGSLGEMASLMSAHGHGVNQQRQEGPHAHEVVISQDNRLAYVPDLGLDEIRLYKIDPSSAKLSPNEPPAVKQDAGMGPRHLVFSEDESFAYVINELKSEVSVFKHDKASGSMTKVEDVSTLPDDYKGENGPAEILLDHKGKFLYTTNRGADSVAVFSVDSGSGRIKRIQVISAEGKMPRGLAFDPTGKYLFAGNQKTNNFVVFRVDASSGELKPTGQVVNTPSPVAFTFIPAQ